MTDLPPLPDRPLNVCFVGVGAIGGAIAAPLAQAAAAGTLPELGQLTLVARGPHLAAMQTEGLRLTSPEIDPPVAIPVTAVEDLAGLPPQDVVITALKGHQVPAMAEALAALLAPHGRIVPIVNGVPWWYPLPDASAPGGYRGATEVDPEGKLWSLIGPERAIGAVAFMGASVPEPGLIHVELPGFLELGRLSGQDRSDVARIADLLRKGGVTVKETEPFEEVIWTKLLANCSMNSTTAICRASMSSIVQDPVLASFVEGIMTEIIAIAGAQGVTIDPALPRQRLEKAKGNRGFKTSTLQDLEKGRPMEIEPIFAATCSVAAALDIPTPNLSLATAILRSVERDRFPA
ncbi:ketopantoate reductase family protein [Pseudooceanicola nanhaiensis]|uniref:ketopantoate reductase family protein n=1 Tax=Pseudooceanicola nanhaiensis TaxID=375761 RepID=UPI001CD69F78|nr:2-dehydropantoate 2-reductase [Pseudooceanicola nanhaiensis]MCA0922209.1 2-dehydropantoate 2-reductase [Pseudooceanicola nanhaiensis]